MSAEKKPPRPALFAKGRRRRSAAVAASRDRGGRRARHAAPSDLGAGSVWPKTVAGCPRSARGALEARGRQEAGKRQGPQNKRQARKGGVRGRQEAGPGKAGPGRQEAAGQDSHRSRAVQPSSCGPPWRLAPNDLAATGGSSIPCRQARSGPARAPKSGMEDAQIATGPAARPLCAALAWRARPSRPPNQALRLGLCRLRAFRRSPHRSPAPTSAGCRRPRDAPSAARAGAGNGVARPAGIGP